MILALAIGALLFGSIVIFALEIQNLSNYIDAYILVKKSLWLSIPACAISSYLIYRDSHWVRPLVYRVMAFTCLMILIISPLMVHLVNFYAPSEIEVESTILSAKIHGHSISRFGKIAKSRELKKDYYRIDMVSTQEEFTYRLDDLSEIDFNENMRIITKKGYFRIPFRKLIND